MNFISNYGATKMKYRIVVDGFKNYQPEYKYQFWPFWQQYPFEYAQLKEAISYIEYMKSECVKAKTKKLVVWEE